MLFSEGPIVILQLIMDLEKSNVKRNLFEQTVCKKIFLRND